jgi:hypothetical protein
MRVQLSYTAYFSGISFGNAHCNMKFVLWFPSFSGKILEDLLTLDALFVVVLLASVGLL